MIIRLVLAYVAAALAVSTPGLTLAAVIYIRTWRNIRTTTSSRRPA